jgi:uncharacterized protein YegL
MILCLGVLGANHEMLVAQDSSSITAEFAASPARGVVAETDFDVTITLRGDTSTCPPQAINRPVDAVLVLDTSGSMAGDGIESARQAATVFIDTLSLDSPPPAGAGVPQVTDSDQIAIVTYASGASELSPLSTDAAALRNIVAGLQDGGGTRTAQGLEAAIATLNDPTRANPVAVKALILLADGDSDDPDEEVINLANAAKAAGIRIVAVGLGDFDDTLLRQIVSSSADYIEAPTPAELPEIFRRVATTIQPTTAGSDIEMIYRYDSALFDVDPASIFPPPSQVVGSEITWVYGRIDGGEAPEFTFRARAQQILDNPVGTIISGSYLACESDTRVPITGTGPVVVAQAPSPTPPPTSTPTPLPTSTPLPTPTPTLPALLRNDTIVPASNLDSSLTLALGFCANNFGTLLPIIAAILIILLLVLPWLLWHWRRLRDGDINAACFIMRALLGGWAAFALWLFLLPPLAAVCEGQESVYFWRQEGATRVTGIYLTAPNLDTATGFGQINSGGCVGCHTVNSEARRVAAIASGVPGVITVRSFDGSVIPVPDVEALYMAFSPQGDRIVFSDSEPDLHILDIETGVITPLAGASTPGVVETMPSWGPNGQIAFVRAPDRSGMIYEGLEFTHPLDIYTIPETGGQAQPLAGASGSGFNYYPSYSPQGDWLAFTRHNNRTTYSDPQAEIFVVPAAGGAPVRLNANDDANGSPIVNASNSWPTWSLDGMQLAFNSKRNDELYDIYMTAIDPLTGQSGAAQPLSAAAQRGVFEHTPFWGLPVAQVDVLRNMGALWPFLLPLLPLAMLAWVACRRRTEIIEEPPPPIDVKPLPPPPIPKPLRQQPLTAPWQPQPMLIIGLGNTGREVLTQLKKTLRDAQLGEMPEKVRLIGLDTGDYQTLQGEIAPIRFAGVELNEGEIIEIRDNLANVVTDAEFRNNALTRGWLTDDAIRTIGSEQRLNLRQGANQQRVLARAGLIHHLQTAEVSFFDRLLQIAPECLSEDRELNIQIVGDTFGDIGSAVLFDVALLAREVGRRTNAQGVSITAHLITAEAIRNFTKNREQDLANTGATLREIERYQLAEARPFPIFYPQIERGVCDQLPLDDLFFYDGTGLELERPQDGVFPAVADSIALWMDKAAQRGVLRELQSDQRSKISQTQRDTYQVHVFSQGMFVYRLPFADLLENIRTRFAQEIFRLLLMGRSVEDEQIRLDPTLNKEPFMGDGSSADNVAIAFLTGALSVQSDLPAPGYALSALKQLLRPDPDAGKVIATLRLLEPNAQAALLAGLRGAINLLLNGSQEYIERDIFRARGGKLGFTMDFLDALVRRINALIPRLDSIRDAQDKRDQFRAVLSELRDAASVARDSLHAQARALGAVEGIRDNLNAVLGRRSFDLKARLDEMNQIKTRHYIAERMDENGQMQELADLWYRQHLFDKRGDALRQFYWRVDEDAKATLLLYGENETALDPDNVAAFEQVLIEMATRYCSDIRNRESFASALAADELVRDRIPQTGRTLRENGRVLLSFDPIDAPNLQVDAILTAHETVPLESLSDEIAQFVGGQAHLHRIHATDPYSLALNQRVTIVPFAAIRTLRDAREYYRQNHGLLDDPRAIRRETPIPTAVHEAEAAALELEARIRDELRLRPDLLHPLVVTALTVPQRVTAFALSLAAGNIALQKQRGSQTLLLVLYTDDAEITFPGTWRGRAIGSDLHPLAQGLLMFVLDTVTFDDNLVNTIIQRSRTDDTLPDIFKQWVGGAWQEWLDTIDENNLSHQRSEDIVEDILKVSRLYANQYRQ